MGTLARLQREMAAWGVAPPEEGWKAWSARFKNAATEADAAPGEEGRSSASHTTRTLKGNESRVVYGQKQQYPCV